MGQRSNTLHFHKRLKFTFSVLVVNGDTEVFLVENEIFGLACRQATCFLEKGRGKPEWELKCGML